MSSVCLFSPPLYTSFACFLASSLLFLGLFLHVDTAVILGKKQLLHPILFFGDVCLYIYISLNLSSYFLKKLIVVLFPSSLSSSVCIPFSAIVPVASVTVFPTPPHSRVEWGGWHRLLGHTPHGALRRRVCVCVRRLRGCTACTAHDPSHSVSH